MLRTFKFVLLLAFACANVSVGEAKEKVPDSNRATQTSNSDQRGTPNLPLEVNTRAIQSDSEAAEEKARDAEQKRVNGYIIGLTWAIAVCAFLQFCGIVGQIVVYLKQTGIMRDTLNAIKRQADIMETQATDSRTAAASADEVSKSTLAAITMQADLMRRQADAMDGQSETLKSSVEAAQAAADAAKQSLELTINQARVRISAKIASVEKLEHPRVNFTMTSRGPTTAVIKSANYAAFFSPFRVNDWSETNVDSKILLPEMFTPQEFAGWGFLFCGDRIGRLFNEVSQGDMFLHFRAVVSYRDVFRIDRETSIALTYGKRDGLYGLISGGEVAWVDGPSEYNYAT